MNDAMRMCDNNHKDNDNDNKSLANLTKQFSNRL